MKKINVVDSLKVNNYIDSVSIDKFNIGVLLKTINSGKNKYEIPDIFNYLVDFTYNSLIEKKALTNKKLAKYVYAIMTILSAYNHSKYYIGDDLITKIKSLEELYISNRSLTGKDGDDKLIEYFEDTKSIIEENASFKKKNKEDSKKEDIKESKKTKTVKKEEPVKETITEENTEEKSSAEYENIISKLKAKIESLEKDLAEYEKAMRVSSSQNSDDQKKINQLNQKINRAKLELNSLRKKSKKDDDAKEKLSKDINKSNEKIDRLNRTIDEYALKIIEKKKTIEKLQGEIESFKKEIESNEYTIGILNERIDKQIEELNESKIILDNATTKQDLLDNFILEQLFVNRLSLDAIVKIVVRNGYDVTKQEVIDSLKRINRIVNVKPRVAFDKKYGVIEPAIRTDQKLNIPDGSNKLEMVFLADYHYDANEEATYFLQEKLNSVYNYCANHNIKTIITLGDLIDNKCLPLGVTKENFEIIKAFLKDFDKILPYDVGIKHFILGGNHDRAFLKYGIDPIEELSFEREDTIPLGYSNAYMTFGNSDIIGLHHEGVPKESLVPNPQESGKEVKEHLERAYENAKLNVANRYFDFFGHFHKGRIDSNNAFGIVPSVSFDRNADGAWHITFETDKNGRIVNMVINSLVFGKARELKVATETVYQRKK